MSRPSWDNTLKETSVIIEGVRWIPESQFRIEKGGRIIEFLESSEFYDLMQDYRNAPVEYQDIVIECFEAVKEKIIEKM